MQLEGLFDVARSETSREIWNINLSLPDAWNVGVIVGPSGCGKTTIANEIFPDNVVSGFEWSDNKSIVDDFPEEMGIKDICHLLSSVGFSSPPSWVRPFRVLSNGEKFRVTLARGLAENSDLLVFDEFSSVVDRTVAKIGSTAVSRTVRNRDRRFIAVTCHYDILEWLEPDWIFEPHLNEFHNGRYLQRPEIEIEIHRTRRDWWRVFRKHHYLSADIHIASACFLAVWNGVPVAFVASLNFPHPKIKKIRREHRLVCLPDFQGVGIGNALSEWVAGYWRELGYRYQSSTSHPGVINHRNKSSKWKMIRKPSFSRVGRKSGRIGGTRSKSEIKKRERAWKGVENRLTASFEYIGDTPTLC
jgi:ABC-type nitrate/sulfonate/bicarbonate transport system ATPase subunit